MKIYLCATIALFLCFTSITRAESEEVTIETAEDDNNMAQPMVLDPEVAEEIRKEKEEEREHAKHAAANKNKTVDNVKPEIVVLYRPKLCKRQSNSGDLMVVHYTGWLAKSGRKFDTTIDIRRRYAPFEFVVGTGYVIKGWDKGLMDMCPGEKRKLIVPSSLGYGKKGLRGTIPPNSTLIFVIDLLDLRRATPSYVPMDLFTSLDRDGDKTLSRDEISDYVRYQARIYRKKDAPMPSHDEHEKMVDEIMQKEDKNGDGVIQHTEFSGPKIPHGGEL